LVAKKKPDAKSARLDTCLAAIEKSYGKGAVVRFNVKEMASEKLPGYSTGSIGLDALTGANGIPKRCITEFSGKPSCGKTTIALQTIAHAQLEGENAAFIDFEQEFDPRYARKLGVDMNKIFISQPAYGEEGLDILQKFLEARAAGIIVVDSIANITPRSTMENEIGDATWAGRARLLSQAIEQQLVLIRKNDVCVIYLNQIRANMNAMKFGPKTDTPGGYAAKHNSGLRVEFSRIGTLKDGERKIGGRTRAKVLKNRVGGFPYAEAEFDLFHGVGTSLEYEIFDYGVKFGFIKKADKRFTVNGESIGTGREKCRQFLKLHPALSLELEKLVRPALEAEYAQPALDELDGPAEVDPNLDVVTTAVGADEEE
jgi:recombination protein RecA